MESRVVQIHVNSKVIILKYISINAFDTWSPALSLALPMEQRGHSLYVAHTIFVLVSVVPNNFREYLDYYFAVTLRRRHVLIRYRSHQPCHVQIIDHTIAESATVERFFILSWWRHLWLPFVPYVWDEDCMHYRYGEPSLGSLYLFGILVSESVHILHKLLWPMDDDLCLFSNYHQTILQLGLIRQTDLKLVPNHLSLL